MRGRVCPKRGMLLDAAKIGTCGERSEDVFCITEVGPPQRVAPETVTGSEGAGHLDG